MATKTLCSDKPALLVAVDGLEKHHGHEATVCLGGRTQPFLGSNWNSGASRLKHDKLWIVANFRFQNNTPSLPSRILKHHVTDA